MFNFIPLFLCSPTTLTKSDILVERQSSNNHAFNQNTKMETVLEKYKALDEFHADDPHHDDWAKNLRPWCINNDTKKCKMKTLAQYALYKCMNQWCTYATDSKENWKIHMDEHIFLLFELMRMELIGGKDDVYQVKLAKFHVCHYCGDDSETEHMETEHRGSIFQCSYCFYRTIEIDNLILHMEKYHSNADRGVLLYKIDREFQPKDEAEIINGCKKNVTKIKCAIGNFYK